MENNNKFEVISRALIIKNDEILLCFGKEAKNYFLPGGHVEFGENAEKALLREIKEEMNTDGEIENFAGVFENSYTDKSGLRDEINLCFSVKMEEANISSVEDYIAFEWIPIERLEKINFLPDEFAITIGKWTKDKKVFYESVVK